MTVDHDPIVPAVSWRAGEPVSGGTLRLLSPSTVPHLDPACSYDVFSGQLLRAVTRQLFTYPSRTDASDPLQAYQLVADVAAELPSRRNGGISADGHVYTVRLRPDVLWDTVPRRPVVAADFVRGLKRLGNPVTGTGGIRYFTSTVVGMREYHESYLAAFRRLRPTARRLAEFQNAHHIAGCTAVDDTTLVFRLRTPANDFLHVLATGFASPAPEEYDQFLPDSEEFRENLRSAGPYRMNRYRSAGRELRFDRNPAWNPHSDPARAQFVDAIEVTATAEPPEAVLGKLARCEADLAWSMDTVSWSRSWSGPETIMPGSPGYALHPYLVFNLRSPNADAATRRLPLRRAVALAIDRHAISRVLGTLDVPHLPLHGVIPPGCVGHSPYDPYPTPGGRGDPAAARAVLRAAGFDEPPVLVAAVRDSAPQRAVMESVARDLRTVGIRLAIVTYGQNEFYTGLLSDPAQGRAGAWDVALPGWLPDWFGNNGRAVVQPLFESNDARGTANYGGYRNPHVDRLIAAALSATDAGLAGELWHQVDRQVMADVAVVPLLAFAVVPPRRYSPRLRNLRYLPQHGFFDLTSVWLAR